MDKKIDSINEDINKFLKNVTVKDLVKILRYLSKAYYNTGISKVPDKLYDKLIDYLKITDPDNEYFNEIGAPVNTKDKIKLPFPMGSLNKIKPNNKLHSINDWLKKFNGSYIASDKLDGVSVQLYKKNGEISLFTRGNGIEGRRINNLIKSIFKNNDFSLIPDDTSIRGELIIKKNNFIQFNKEFKNARNLVSGIVNSDKKNKTVDVVDFVAYNILYPEYLYQEQLDRLKAMKLNVVKYREINRDNFENELIEYYNKRRIESEYEIDGIVVADNSQIYRLKHGNPDHMVAFKMDDNNQEYAVVKVKEIVWQISMYGYLNPIIKIDPVELSGVSISNITGNNAKYIYDNKLGKNAEIKIIRSGDVIPKIIEIIKPCNKPDMPIYKTKWTDTRVDLIVDEYPPEVKREIECAKILHFFQTIKVHYISEGIIKKLYDNKYISIIDILTADREKLKEINGLGDKLINKIYDEIDKQMGSVKLYELMSASLIFGRGLGSKKIKSILEIYDNILDIDFESEEECIDMLLKIEGIGNIQATQFCNNLNNFKEFYKKINKIYKVKITKTKKKNKLNGMNIVISGFRNSELERLIEENGGHVKTSVSKNTDLLIYKLGVEPTSKYNKAVELGIKIVTEEEFMKSL